MFALPPGCPWPSLVDGAGEVRCMCNEITRLFSLRGVFPDTVFFGEFLIYFGQHVCVATSTSSSSQHSPRALDPLRELPIHFILYSYLSVEVACINLLCIPVLIDQNLYSKFLLKKGQPADVT